ncbi:HAD family hydrolase [Aurantivibrio infirmus]
MFAGFDGIVHTCTASKQKCNFQQSKVSNERLQKIGELIAVALVLFDLDNTLIAGDSDLGWGEFLVEQKLVDTETYQQRNEEFYQAYCRGELDIQAYIKFAAEPLSKFSATKLSTLREKFIAEKIQALRLPKAELLIEHHKEKGDIIAIVTATNRFITQPIASLLKIEHLLATELEIIDGHYTGNLEGEPCYQAGKIIHLERWLAKLSETEDPQDPIAEMDRYFYSDSINDLPLLEKVNFPFAVDPDEKLAEVAKERQWPIISLRDASPS